MITLHFTYKDTSITLWNNYYKWHQRICFEILICLWLGQRYYIHVVMNNLEDNGTLHNVFFMAENGSTLLENECTIQVADNFIKCIVQLTIPKCVCILLFLWFINSSFKTI